MSRDKTKPSVVRCHDCLNAYLMRSNPINPIVAQCKLHTHRREVASTRHVCPEFITNPHPIVINPLIPAL